MPAFSSDSYRGSRLAPQGGVVSVPARTVAIPVRCVLYQRPDRLEQAAAKIMALQQAQEKRGSDDVLEPKRQARVSDPLQKARLLSVNPPRRRLDRFPPVQFVPLSLVPGVDIGTRC